MNDTRSGTTDGPGSSRSSPASGAVPTGEGGERGGTGGRIILYCAADLVWASRIKETACALGIGARPVRSVEMLEARLADSAVAGLLVDLDADAAMAVIERGARTEPGRDQPSPGGQPVSVRVPIVAFGPHVEVGKLRAAQAAGAQTVLARGAFASGLTEILTKLAKAPEAGAGSGVLASRFED